MICFYTLLFQFNFSLDDADFDAIKEKGKSIFEKLKKVKSNNCDRLDYFCPWLTNYQWYGGDDFIELPGQYTGNAMPNPSRLLKIVKFNETVTILHSLRKPIRMSAICSDGKSYSFMVKYGEDLRQDERIQQIQQLMSDQMKSDKNCSQQKLSLRTYKVTPFNVNCGIIGWVENTESIQTFLSEKISNWKHISYKIRTQYDDFMVKAEKEKNKKLPSNVAAALHYSQTEVAIYYSTHIFLFVIYRISINRLPTIWKNCCHKCQRMAYEMLCTNSAHRRKAFSPCAVISVKVWPQCASLTGCWALVIVI